MYIKELWLKGLPAQDPSTLASMAQLGLESLVGWVPSCLLSPIPSAAMGAYSNNSYNSDRRVTTVHKPGETVGVSLLWQSCPEYSAAF